MDKMDRLKKDLVLSGTFGREDSLVVEKYDQVGPHSGVTRPTGSEDNKKIRDYAVAAMKAAGLDVRIDRIGNIFGRREGSQTRKGTIMCGSHLDSVVNGGMLDGAAGVFAAIEAIRRMNDEGFENKKPLEVVVFTGEEGSAFGQTLLGSSVLTGKIELQKALNMKNAEAVTLGESLERIGYAGDFQRDLDDVEFMLELHIEQGPVLDRENIAVGIVENIAGIAWIMASFTGQENHAGTTPMKMRKDALVAAAEIVSFVNRRANEISEKKDSFIVGTVGKLSVFPNGTNAIPGKVEIGIDIRDVRRENIEILKNETLQMIDDVGEKYGLGVDIQTPLPHEPTVLSPEVVQIVEQSAKEIGVSFKRMHSGAGHDSQSMASRVKTGMIFVPSINGISHAPTEWTAWEDMEKGAKVLTQTLKNLSSR